MFNWFKKSMISDDESDIQDLREDLDSAEIEQENGFLKNLIYRNNFVKFYYSDARDFVPNMITWSSQRNLNLSHIQSLVDSLKKLPHFMGTFKIVRDEDGIVRLIDGQHRFHALKTIMENDSKFNCDLILELYETDKIDSESTIQLFRNANTVLNIESKDMPDLMSHRLVERMCGRYPKMIIESEIDKRVNRPRMNKRELYLKLKEFLTETILDEEDIYKQIVDINNVYGMRKRELFKKITDLMYLKAKQSGFYIGLDSNFEWVNKIF